MGIIRETLSSVETERTISGFIAYAFKLVDEWGLL